MRNYNDMTKEELIKEAWCNQCLEQVDENGWLEIGYCVNGFDDIEYWLSDNFFKRDLSKWEISCSELDNGELINVKIRPKSLQGIENNNGWIKIESEADFPKDSFNYYLYCNDGRLLDMKEYDYYKKYLVPELKATHYQPIEKPKPPLY